MAMWYSRERGYKSVQNTGTYMIPNPCPTWLSGMGSKSEAAVSGSKALVGYTRASYLRTALSVLPLKRSLTAPASNSL